MITELLQFLQSQFDPSASNLQHLGGGMFSQAYRFETSSQVLVIRLGVTQEAFKKDQFAYEQLGHVLAVPRMLAIGEFSPSLFYCISEWKPGQVLTDFEKNQTERLLPSIFANLLAMSRVTVPPETSFGILNSEGRARKQYDSWAQFIQAVDDFPDTFTPRGDEVYKPWDELFATTFLDKQLVIDARQRLNKLLPFLPNERHYVHGDFGYENALADGETVSAILDWAELRCGDWLYDLAYIAYNDPLGVDYLTAFEAFIKQNQLVLPHFSERIQAYYLHIWLGNVFLGANRGMNEWYDEDVAVYHRLILS